MDTRQRTLVKAVLWSLLGLASMALVGALLTGSASLGGVMALINTLIGLCCYVIYERIWAGVRWGRAEVGRD
ncbi:DUF2061 domain-containing protein [Frigidibacter sp. RF13]|uniref:DUF2061 domain-containing protein n=1 Tax=Frigidibacter sp. RF13 TaxID=2997340 RepID=UPI00226F9C14|nr:DUF2061 domain-containing protein [Frigidibacter sp. RF13]MCY1126328.1 DUF2061 domain-containing protein [Frigidibacter sp. RF13]